MVQQFPLLDVLVNNAGIKRNLDLDTDHDLADVTREIDTHLAGPVRTIQQFLPHLRTRPDALIVNVSPGPAFVPLPLFPVYSATKAAIHSLSQSLRVRLHRTSITIVELAPPGVETPLLRNEFAEEMEDEQGMDVGVLVTAAIRGIEAGRLEIRPGLSNVLKMMSRLAPQLMLHQLAKMGRPKALASGWESRRRDPRRCPVTGVGPCSQPEAAIT